jgi:hypothetical protein
MMIAAFGPYTGIPGMRTEQLVVYALFPVCLASCARAAIRVGGHSALIAVLFSMQAAIAVLNPVANVSPYQSARTLLAGLDNLVLPAAVLVIMWAFTNSTADRQKMIRTACTVLVLAMSVNAILALISSTYDLRPLLVKFWTGNVFETSTAENAAQMGRFSGIVNQPAEAGILYSLALIAGVYLYRHRVWLFSLVSAVLVVGGTLTVSKIFLVVGLPVALWQALRASERRLGRTVAVVGLGGAGLGLLGSGTLAGWQGSQGLTGLLAPAGDQDFLYLYTAGRFGDSSTLHAVTDAVLHYSPWFGFGLRGLGQPYDNGWVEALAVSGLAGAAIHTVVLGALVAAWWSRRGRVPRAESMLAGGVVLILVGASLGLPALTANRVATVAWILIGLLLLAPLDKGAGRGTGTKPSVAEKRHKP